MTIPVLHEKKARGEKITALTAYDLPFARLLDQAGVDIVLVGDSLGMVALGYPNTVPVTMREMIHHTKAVRRGVSRAMLVGDMPFMSFHVSKEAAVRNAGRFMKEGGCDAVKVEGGQGSVELAEAVRSIVGAGIPVLGHLGLTPQTASNVGGFRVQAKTAKEAEKLLEACLEMEELGCFGLVLECVPSQAAQMITSRLRIPAIGIGAGPHCDGQILVTQDLLNLTGSFHPKFIRTFARLDQAVLAALQEFQEAVRNGSFPSQDESYLMPAGEWEQLKKLPA